MTWTPLCAVGALASLLVLSPTSHHGSTPPGKASASWQPEICWEGWWGYNKARFFGIRRELYPPAHAGLGLPLLRKDLENPLRPDAGVVMKDIVPALGQVLTAEGPEDPDLVSSAMMALAKIGRDCPEFRLVDLFRPRLAADNQDVRETAALALGIAGETGTAWQAPLDLLVGLALDDEFGREVSGGVEVHERTRAFAAYGMGLFAHQEDRIEAKHQIFVALRSLLGSEEPASWDLSVAAIHGLSLLLREGDDELIRTLRAEAVAALESFYARRLGAEYEVVRAHCPTAIAKLIGPDDPRAGHFRARFARDLLVEAKPDSPGRHVRRSCAVALGRLCRPFDDEDSPDARFSESLLEQHLETEDEVLRSFAIMALAEIGGRANRLALIRAFEAVALGDLADKELLPWNSMIVEGTNWTAQVQTLTNRMSGVLDLL